jgi:hypothetical protein
MAKKAKGGKKKAGKNRKADLARQKGGAVAPPFPCTPAFFEPTS